MGNKEKSIEPNDLLELYWNYYQLHAEQRFKILEFFISVEIVLFGTFTATIYEHPHIALVSGILASGVSLICYWLDKRTVELIHHCRIAIRTLEEKYMTSYPEESKLFTNVKNKEKVLNYSKLIRGAYLIVIFIGIIMIITA